MWQVFLAGSCKSIFGNDGTLIFYMYASKEFIFLISIFGSSKERISNPNSFTLPSPKIQPRLHCSCDHGKTKPRSFGQNKTAVGSKSPDRHFFPGIWTKCCQQKSHKSHKSRSFQHLPSAKMSGRNSAINHQPSKNSGHQDVKPTKWPTLKRNKRALGLARRPQRGQRKQLRCNDSALRKRRASEAARRPTWKVQIFQWMNPDSTG